MKRVVKTILSPDGLRKVEIYQRGNGSFGFVAMRFSNEPTEMCWREDGRYSACHTPTIEIAEREARGRVKWLAEG